MNQRKYVLVLSYHVAAREREIREGETKFLYNMKFQISAAKSCRVSGVQSFKVPETLNVRSLQFLNVKISLISEWRRLRRRRRTLFEPTQQVMHFTNTLEYKLIILKCMINKHVFMNLASLSINFSPH